MANLGTAIAYLMLDISQFKTGFQDAQRDLNKFSDSTAGVGSKIQGIGKSVSSVGTTLTKNLTVPIAGAGAQILKTSVDFEQGMSKVQSLLGITDKTSESMIRLTEKAREMGAKTKFSATESASAFEYMAQAGWNAEQMIDGIEGVMLLAAATGEDLAATSDIVTDALTAFGLTADETGRFVDVLAVAANATNTDVLKMGESFKYVAPVAGALGFTVEDTAIGLGLMANSGIKSSMAGMQLRSAFVNLVNPTDKMATLMQRYNIQVTDSQGNMLPLIDIMRMLRTNMATMTEEQQAQTLAMMLGIDVSEAAKVAMEELDESERKATLAYEVGREAMERYTAADQEKILKQIYGTKALKEMTQEEKERAFATQIGAEQLERMTDAQQAAAASTIFGKQAMSGWLAIINSSEEDFNNLTESIYNSNGAVQEMHDIYMDNAAGSMEILKSGIEEVMLSFGDLMLPALKEGIAVIQSIIDKINALDPAQKQQILNITLIVAAIGPIILILGKLITAIGSIISIGGVLISGVKSLFALIAAHPVLALITAISALVVGIVAWSNANAEADAKLKEITTSIDSFNQKVSETTPQIVSMNDMLTSYGASYTDLQNVIDTSSKAITEILQNALQEQRALRQDEISDLYYHNEHILAAQQQRAELVRAQQTSEMMKLEQELTTITQDGLAQRLANADEYHRMALEEADKAWTTQITLIEQKHQAMGTVNSEAYNSELAAAKQSYDQQVSAANSNNTKMYSLATTAAKNMVTSETKKWKDLETLLFKFVGKNEDGVQEMSKIQTFFTYNGKRMKDEYSDAMSEMDLNTTSAFLSMLYETHQKGGEITEENKAIATEILNTFNVLPDQLKESGKNILLGLIGGIEDTTPELQNVSEMSAQDIVSILTNVLGIQSPSTVAKDIGYNTIEGLILGMQGQLSALKTSASNAGSSMVDSLLSGMQNRWSTLKYWLEQSLDWIRQQFEQIEGAADVAYSGGKQSNKKRYSTGLTYVPYDNYSALLHRGERVLTKQENEQYSRGEKSSSNGDTYIFYTYPGSNEVELKRQFMNAKRDVALGLDIG